MTPDIKFLGVMSSKLATWDVKMSFPKISKNIFAIHIIDAEMSKHNI